jgi:hypothetical protein
MNFTLGIGKIYGLPSVEEVKLRKLIKLWDNHKSSNDKKNRYYGGHVRLSDVNLGIALPNGLNSLEIGCEWGAKTVDVLAARSMFDGFVSSNGKNNDLLQKIMSDNRLISEYMKACKDQLKYGCTFATLSADEDIGCKIRFHSPLTASAIWNGEKGRIDCGLAIIDTKIDNKDQMYKPSHVNLYTDTDIWELTKISDSTEWKAEKFPHIMGRPLMEPLVWNATSDKPFGRSRIKEPVRRLIEGYVRTVANASIALEFSTTPQKYLLGITDEQYDALINEKFKTYVGSIIAGTTNPDTGQTPEFGQLSQGTLEPHVQMLRMLATQFSAATGLTVTDTGVVNDANPTSSDAILAQSQTLVLLAEQLNTTNSDALKVIARMAQAIVRGVELDKLTDEEESIVPHFKNPAMPSVSVTADAAVKIASVRPNFSQTDTFLEMVGFDQADIRRINAQEQRSRGTQVLSEEFNADISE